METVRLKLEQIRTDGGTQPRGELDLAVVSEYADAMRGGAQFPNIEVVYDGTDYWLWDGFHRVQGARYVHLAEIAASVRQGTLEDAQWYSYGANQAHGLRRSNEDKQRAVKAALLHPLGACKSDSQIAAHVGVTHPTVRKWRAELELSCKIYKIDQRTVTRNGTTYIQNTARIGARQPEAAPEALPQAVLMADPANDDARSPGLESLPVTSSPCLITPERTSSRSEAEWSVAGSVTASPRPPLTVSPSPPVTVGPVTIWNQDARQLAQCVPAESVHLVMTSPPYNVGIDYGQHDDAMPEEEYWELLRSVFGHCWQAMVPGARVAVVVPFGVGRSPWRPVASRVAALLKELGFSARGQIVWDKGSTGNRTSWGSWRLPTNPSLRDTTEAIVVAHKIDERLNVPQTSLTQEDGTLVSPWLSPDLFMELAQDHWQVPPESAQAVGHPAPFPVALAERLVRFYAYPGAHVLDPFAGSGTVGVAALRLGCRATLVEIDDGYCRMAEERCRREQWKGRGQRLEDEPPCGDRRPAAARPAPILRDSLGAEVIESRTMPAAGERQA